MNFKTVRQLETTNIPDHGDTLHIPMLTPGNTLGEIVLRMNTADWMGVLDEQEAAMYKRGEQQFVELFTRKVATELAEQLIEQGAVQIDTEYDMLRQQTLAGARIRYMVEEK